MLSTLLNQKNEYLKSKKSVVHTPLEKSIDKILERINEDINKIIDLNQIENI